MGHSICALIVIEPLDERAAREWDVAGVPLGERLRLVHISSSYAAYWQARLGVTEALDVPPDFPPIFPREGVVASLAAALAGTAPSEQLPTFALVVTDYFGGAGDQWACAFVAGYRVEGVRNINAALRVLGVEAATDLDEFDTVGLAVHRRTPDHLARYEELCDDLGA